MEIDLLPEADIHWDYIRLAMRSVADTCIIPVQDYLGLGCEARINTPSTLGAKTGSGVQTQTASRTIWQQKLKKITQLCARSLQQKRRVTMNYKKYLEDQLQTSIEAADHKMFIMHCFI